MHGGDGAAAQLGTGASSVESRWRDGADKVDAGLGQTAARLYGGPHVTDKERRKSSISARFLLTGRSGGNDQKLPPKVRSTIETSKSPLVTTGRSQSPVDPIFIFFA